MDMTTPSGSTPGDPVAQSRFEASPDPLLNRRSDTYAVNLYAPGPLERFPGPTRMVDSAEENAARARGQRGEARDRHTKTRYAQPDSAPAQFEFEARERAAEEVARRRRPRKSRGVALLLAVLFGQFGAHNFYLGLHTRGLRFILLTLACITMTGGTGIVLFLLPIPALLLVEMVQISGGTGPYTGVNFRHEM